MNLNKKHLSKKLLKLRLKQLDFKLNKFNSKTNFLKCKNKCKWKEQWLNPKLKKLDKMMATNLPKCSKCNSKWNRRDKEWNSKDSNLNSNLLCLNKRSKALVMSMEQDIMHHKHHHIHN